MRFVWEMPDIKGGRIVGKPGRFERHMIVACPTTGKYAMASLADGSLSALVDYQTLICNLNNSGEIPIEFVEIIAP